MVTKRARSLIGDPSLVIRALADAVRENGIPCNGNDNAVALAIADAEKLYSCLSKSEREWVKCHGLQTVVLDHGLALPNVEMSLSKSKKSIVLKTDADHLKKCVLALVGYIQANGVARADGKTSMHIQLIPNFYSRSGKDVRDTILSVEPEHRGANVLPKSMKRGERLRNFVRTHGRIVQGHAIASESHYLILTITSVAGGLQPHDVASFEVSPSQYVKSRMKDALFVSTRLNESQTKILRKLRGEKMIGVDLEGRLEQRNPCVSLLQIASAEGDVFAVLDLIACPQLLLPPEQGGDDAVSREIRSLLLEKEVVLHDCRHDAAALWGQFGICPPKIFDTQVGFSVLKYGAAAPWKRHGFNEVAKAHGIENPLKKKIKHREGLWEQRPLPPDLLAYAVFDVLPLVRMAVSMMEKCNELLIDTIYRCSKENASAFRDTSVRPSFLEGSFFKAAQNGCIPADITDIEAIATRFHRYVSSEKDLREKCADRSVIQDVFQDWLRREGIHRKGNTLPFILAILRKKKLLKSRRHGDLVLMIFSFPDGSFPSQRERAETRSRALKSRETLEEDKNGIQILCSSDVKQITAPVGQSQRVTFTVQNTANTSRSITEIKLLGSHQHRFQCSFSGNLPCHLAPMKNIDVHVSFMSNGPGVFRSVLALLLDGDGSQFSIARFLTARSGDSDVSDLLKPIAPYKKIERKRSTINEGDIVDAPKAAGGGGKFAVLLPFYFIPSNVRKLLKYKEMDSVLESHQPVSVETYPLFWKSMLWASEYQALMDVMLFDMENVSLRKNGNYFALNVPGLAEGRPSVLRGDHVIVTLNGRSFKGLTVDTHLEQVILDFKPVFRNRYDERLNRVNVRFTISRSIFRAGHQGCSEAPDTMGKQMLFPDEVDMTQALARDLTRPVPVILKWRNRSLNPEQKAAVTNVLKGSARPLPYIIFGPPGTGKTTTLVETVFHLAQHRDSLKILLVAPSNDATDNLVEKLADCFPPSEMRRVLAKSRTIDQVSANVKPYVVEGLDEEQEVNDIMSKKIVAATVNMAAKFYNKGIKPGHFDVLCVDEAGHAIETEVIAVAATLMDFMRTDSKKGQILLAGDPRQLGPVITSTLCKRFGMETSYMERLTNLPIYESTDGSYPEELLTKLVRNFRSHPQILKLPNELFYDSELLACGDHFDTHFPWEHLPERNFPVVFHSVFGENEREANSPSWFNRQEAEVVLDYVRLLVKHSRPSVDMGDIGIITPYARQVQKIRLLLKANDFGNVKVGSVETFQGQERKCIIVSTVRSAENYLEFDAKYNLGFVNNPKRFNVTVTRAKALLIVIGQPYVLATDTKHWKPLLRMCREAGSWSGEPWNDSVVGEEEVLQRMGLLDGHDDNFNEEDDEEQTSHIVSQEAVPFMNREE